jgi:hypothetical protein
MTKRCEIASSFLFSKGKFHFNKLCLNKYEFYYIKLNKKFDIVSETLKSA